jgi:hypothetical protein
MTGADFNSLTTSSQRTFDTNSLIDFPPISLAMDISTQATNDGSVTAEESTLNEDSTMDDLDLDDTTKGGSSTLVPQEGKSNDQETQAAGVLSASLSKMALYLHFQ